MDKKFIKKIVTNNLILILVEISFLFLVITGFLDSLMKSYIYTIDVSFFIMSHLIIFFANGLIFKKRYDFELNFISISKYYLFSFIIFDLFLIFSVSSIAGNILFTIITFFILVLINLFVAFIDFKLRGINK